VSVELNLPPSDAPVRAALPDTVRQALILSRYQLRDYLRSRRFILMVAIVAFIGGIFTLVLAYYHGAGLTGSSTTYYGGSFGGGVWVVMVFAGIIFGGDAIAGEFQNKTGYFLMGLPIRRASVYAGKFLAAVAASVVAVLFFLAILVANGAYYMGVGAAFPLALIESLAIAMLFLLALLGSVFLFSSLFKNSLYAVLVVAVLFLFGFTLIMELLIGLVHIEPWFIIDYVRPVIAYPFMSPLPAHTTPGPDGLTMYNPTYSEGLAVMGMYFLLTTLGGLALFEREEFT
jgi:ABC-2 type transport system permease protein